MGNTSLTNNIIAIVINKKNKDKVGESGAPVFYTDNNQELEQISMLLARLTLGMVHDLGNGVKVIIKH